MMVAETRHVLVHYNERIDLQCSFPSQQINKICTHKVHITEGLHFSRPYFVRSVLLQRCVQSVVRLSVYRL